MLEKLHSYIKQHNLANSGTPVLLACSGGVDSMVLADVLLKLDYKIGIAHCNFQLRGDESDADEKFVEEFAKKNNLSFYSTKFETTAFKKKNDLSTQMAARELRYGWLEKIRKENAYHSIAVAHHLDDQLETILLNLTKGTGIKGLTGMQPKNRFVIRPFLEIAKNEILNYAIGHNIAYREDSSNASDDYQRNLIRHRVIPQLQQVNPSLHETALDFIARMNDYALLSDERLESLKKKCFSEKDGIAEIKTGFIQTHPAGKTILFHLLKDFGFNGAQILQVFETLESLKRSSGKQFLSETHRLVSDRKSLFIIPKDAAKQDHLLIEKLPRQVVFNNYKIDFAPVPVKEVNMKTSGRFAYLDADKLEYPLLLRYWKTGDYFYPFGMGKLKNPDKPGKKKLSKYFKDEKFSVPEKENAAVLFSGEKLVWVVGHRIDERFKVSDKTKNVLKLALHC